MKKIIILVLLILPTILCFGQTDKKVEALFWGNNEGEEYSVEVPEKWKGESAVVLYKNVNYDYSKRGYNMTYTASVRKRIYLNDVASVTRFSEFSTKNNFSLSLSGYWLGSRDMSYIGIKIIKPDGTEIKVDTEKDAVEKGFYRDIAVPNLEVGDVLDYYIMIEEKFMPTTIYVFQAVEDLLAEEFPIKKLKINFQVDNDFYVNFQSYNGAPELDGIVTDTRKNREYEIVAEDIEKIKSTMWNYPYNYLPNYKMQVCFAKTKAHVAMLPVFVPENAKTIKQTVDRYEVLELFDKTLKPIALNNTLKKELKKFVASQNFENKEEKLKGVYYFLRYKFRTQELENDVYRDQRILTDVKYTDPLPFVGSANSMFKLTQLMMSYLRSEDIDYNIIIGKSRYNGHIEDLLLTKNSEILIQIPIDDKNLYFDYFGNNGVMDIFSATLESTTVYKIHMIGVKMTNIQEFELPTSTYDENRVTSTINVSIEDLKNVKIKENVKAFGHQKYEYQNGLMYYTDYIYEDYDKYSGTDFINRIKASKKQLERVKERIQSFDEELTEAKKKRIKESIESGYSSELAEEYNFDILKTGRYSKYEPFEYEQDFTLEDQWIKKAGPNYLFEIGKCIGGQKSIKEDQLERDLDIDMSYARSYNNEITFTIPDGFTVKGLDKLNVNVVNETGGFVSVAVVEGNLLKVTTKKHYASNHVDKENWSQMVKFLDAAFQFTHEKVLLKKI